MIYKAHASAQLLFNLCFVICLCSAAFFFFLAAIEASTAPEAQASPKLPQLMKLKSLPECYCPVCCWVSRLCICGQFGSGSDLLSSELRLLRVQHRLWDHHREPSPPKEMQRLKPVEEKKKKRIVCLMVLLSYGTS